MSSEAKALVDQYLLDLHWAGGLWDGEGSMGLNAHKRRGPTLQASMHQNHPEVLEKFQKIIGLGRVYGPYGPYPGKARSVNPYYQWAVGGTHLVAQFFLLIRPYISSVKIEQGERAIASWKELNGHE